MITPKKEIQMRKFLKIYFKFNIFLNLILMLYSAIAFIAAGLGIDFLMHFVIQIQSFATFELVEWISHPIYIAAAAFFGFFINQYFYHVSITLSNFDKFREITGLYVVPIFALGQLLANMFTLGIIAAAPFVFNVVATILLILVQRANNKLYAQNMEVPSVAIFDPAMQEMSLKIGQLRILKSEGKISEEEFMLHLNNILENKE